MKEAIVTMVVIISWAITASTYFHYKSTVHILNERIGILYGRIDRTNAVCAIMQESPVKVYKDKIKFLRRSLSAVRRDIWSEANLKRLKKHQRLAKLAGKGDSCGR